MGHTTEVGGVGVHSVEVTRALDDLKFLGGEDRQPIAKYFLHVCGVVSEINRISEPADSKIKCMLSRGDVCTVKFSVMLVVFTVDSLSGLSS